MRRKKTGGRKEGRKSEEEERTDEGAEGKWRKTN